MTSLTNLDSLNTKMNNGDIYITETINCKKHSEQDKNIIPYAPTKYDALKNYVKRHRLKWASLVTTMRNFCISMMENGLME